MNHEAIKELIFKMADDDLIIGHRNSEWTGLGPIIEEDISFSSMAQDKIGHALALYEILHRHFDEPQPDKLGFSRNEKDFKCCQLTELPIGEYDFSLIRHFLFDHAEYCRYQLLEGSAFEPLADLSKKIRGELKYHILHTDSWLRKLGNGTKESRTRLQDSLNEALPYALGIFEKADFEETLKADNVFDGEEVLQALWLDNIKPVLKESGLELPNLGQLKPVLGGRKGIHSEHLKPLLQEMTEVFSLDPEADW